MKKLTASLTALVLMTSPLAADPTGFLGFSITFGGQTNSLGMSARVLSNNAVDEWAAGAGLSYYFTGNTGWGFDIGAARNFDRSGAFLGYDILREEGVFSYGTVNTEEEVLFFY